MATGFGRTPLTKPGGATGLVEGGAGAAFSPSSSLELSEEELSEELSVLLSLLELLLELSLSLLLYVVELVEFRDEPPEVDGSGVSTEGFSSVSDIGATEGVGGITLITGGFAWFKKACRRLSSFSRLASADGAELG